MTRAALAVVLLALLLAAPGYAAEQPLVTPAGSSKFPDRALRLTLPQQRALSADQLKVSENGERVRDVTLTSAADPRRTDFGTVLVIDASKSMRAVGIRRAMAAARKLAAQRTGNQQLGVMVFNNTSRVLIAPSSDQRAIEQALRETPELAPQTHVLDAVSTALALLAKAKITAGSVIVLSDGADTGSIVSASAVGARARKANVKVFTIGLGSRSFDVTQLRDLAAAGRGRYFAADSTNDLGAIFRDLGAQLASEYLVRYRSVTQPGRAVTVAVQVGGIDGVATTSYRVPGGTSFVLVEDTLWTSTMGILATTLLCALLLAIAIAMLLLRRHRRPDLRERVHGFVSSLGEITSSAEIVVAGVATRRGAAERSLERTRWWAGFKENCEIARIEANPVRIVAGTAIATLLVMYVLLKVGGPVAALFTCSIPLAVRSWVRFKLDRQRRLFVDQLPDVLQGSASAIRAGHGLTGALAMVAEDAPEPSRAEFQRVVADERLGVPLDEALSVVQRRMDSREVQQIALVAQLQRETGGNIAEVLDRVTESLRRSAELRRMVRSLTAQGRLSRWIVTAIPVFLLLYMTLVNRDYVEPLYTTGLGLFMLAAAGVLMTIGSLVIKKIVDFKV
ncbi:MAG: VWA domain-containing protein [Chloroflexota bacterium]|nr:VWA domain-containing protein [Chloroflexota bacterium]